MSITTDIVESWRRPRVVVRRHLARGRSEPFAFSLLVVFLVLAFVAQWPGASRAAFADGNGPVAPRLLAIGLALLATIPLWYGLAALSRVVARVFGGRGSWYGARIALFWSLVAVGPLMLLQGLVAGMIGPGPGLTAVGVVAGVAFVIFWAVALIEVER
ncbi:MAG: YIP1 family protein [Pseudotabrizicola sp.]|uniref:YIP1 family protein n=1 Tax=Pseudotabrizicola sp. TaxID=2939647 RepID=UPI002723970B|nr:YIP1 family protein [Pseudotabrizicola sp.]MDO8885150.1 YIP1 family protein [Pseudotabrizicola sp.]MDP2082653.1 YIP1 family protein [Pseudotabrizicola sp.]MDZ7573549.1 YIP1 family protein [Pseudotabrizicola sp.]